jgi:transposase
LNAELGGKGMLRMDEMNKIKKAFREGESINGIAKRFKRSWETIKRIIDTPVNEFENRGQRSKRECMVVTSEVEASVEAYLLKEEILGVKKKQRHTAAVIYKQLSASGTYRGSVRRLQEVVKQQRGKRGQIEPKSYLPLEFPLGTTAQFDHGECDVLIAGRREKGYLFICSIPGAVLRYCQVFPIKSSEAWGEFHERAYKFFGGVLPIGIYDNDCVLVKEVIGNERQQTRFSYALEEHYQIKSRFCNPAAGNEKGAVENAVGYCRRNYLPGCPTFGDWCEVNKQLEADCRQTIELERHYKTGRPLKDIYSEMSSQLQQLLVSYTWRRWEEAKVNSHQLVSIGKHAYSVPERFVGSYVQIGAGVLNVEIICDNMLIAHHLRRFGEPENCYNLDHYLDQLKRKPRALWDCQAVQQHKFPSELLGVHLRLQKLYPEGKASRKFIEILLLGRRYGFESLLSGVKKALELGIIEPDAISSLLNDFSSAPSQANSAQLLREQLPHLAVEGWSCDANQYSALERGIAL